MSRWEVLAIPQVTDEIRGLQQLLSVHIFTGTLPRKCLAAIQKHPIKPRSRPTCRCIAGVQQAGAYVTAAGFESRNLAQMELLLLWREIVTCL